MQWVSRLLPPSYVFEAMRQILAGHQPSVLLLCLAFGLNLFILISALWFFSRTFKHAVRTGLIARYSAESVS
jgi:ABC-2 type transport system permease protein